jgi:hypothetical protein
MAAAGATDATIIERLQGVFKDRFHGEKTCTLSFTYNHKSYDFTFTTSHTTHGVSLNNPCIEIHKTITYGFDSSISANSSNKKCFDPVLVTNARTKPEPRTKNLDVLQVLKTKLALCFPTKGPAINLFDAARSDTVMLSPFSLLRGGPGVYEKYGYRSKEVESLKEVLLDAEWRDLDRPSQKLVEAIYDEYLPKEQLLQKDRIIDIMKRVTFEMENETNSKVSEKLYEWYMGELGVPLESIFYELDAESEEWKAWSAKLVFRKLEVVEPFTAVAEAVAASAEVIAAPVGSREERITALQKALGMHSELIKRYENGSNMKKRLEETMRSLEKRLAELESVGGGKRGTKRARRQQHGGRSHAEAVNHAKKEFEKTKKKLDELRALVRNENEPELAFEKRMYDYAVRELALLEALDEMHDGLYLVADRANRYSAEDRRRLGIQAVTTEKDIFDANLAADEYSLCGGKVRNSFILWNIQQDEANILYEVKDHSIVSFCIYSFPSETPSSIYVHVICAAKGKGGKLMQVLKDYVAGHEELEYIDLDSIKNAEGFYKHIGFNFNQREADPVHSMRYTRRRGGRR